MTKRKHSPQHDFWHPRVEGQIRHPEWFTFKDDNARRDCVNSLAKRIVGEIVAGVELASVPEKYGSQLSSQAGSGDCCHGDATRPEHNGRCVQDDTCMERS